MNMETVVTQLKAAREQTRKELGAVETALAALGVNLKLPSKRILSADARARIGAAQRKRWAKVRREARHNGN